MYSKNRANILFFIFFTVVGNIRLIDDKVWIFIATLMSLSQNRKEEKENHLVEQRKNDLVIVICSKTSPFFFFFC